MEDIMVRNPVETHHLKADEFYTLEDIFAELDRLQDDNNALKATVSDLQDVIKEIYPKKSYYDEIGMTREMFR